EYDVIILERRFAKAVKGYSGSPRFARDMVARLAEGRHLLSDPHWEAVRHRVPPRVGAPSRRRIPAKVLDPKTVVEAALFHLQSGVPIRELPESFGPSNDVFNALRRLQSSGAWAAIEPALRRLAPEMFDGLKGSRTFPLN